MVGAVRLAREPEVFDQFAAGGAEERSDDADGGTRLDRPRDRHAGEPVNPRTPEEIEEHGLRLVVRGVTQRDPSGAEGDGRVFQELVAAFARGVFEGDASPAGGRRDIDFAGTHRKPERFGERSHELGVLGRLLAPDSMVEVREHESRELAPLSRLAHHPRQRDRIRPARNRNDHRSGIGPAQHLYDVGWQLRSFPWHGTGPLGGKKTVHKMVEARGFGPLTSALRTRRSPGLSYAPTYIHYTRRDVLLSTADSTERRFADATGPLVFSIVSNHEEG